MAPGAYNGRVTQNCIAIVIYFISSDADAVLNSITERKFFFPCKIHLHDECYTVSTLVRPFVIRALPASYNYYRELVDSLCRDGEDTLMPS